ncbi:MAG: NifU family protein [Erysipelotrichaceae bacterium]
MDTEEKIKTIIDHIRPYINGDGGDIEFVSYLDGIVTIRMLGACVGCSMIDTTVNEGIKGWIMDEIEEVKDVVVEQNFPDFEMNYQDFY